MSPVEIEVMLRFWWDPLADQHSWNPGQVEFVKELLTAGILRYERRASGMHIAGNEEALRPYIEAITSIPLPTQRTTWGVDLSQVKHG